MPSVSDDKRKFLAAQLGVTVGTIADLEKQFYDTYVAGGLAQKSVAGTWAGAQTFGQVGLNSNAPVGKAAAIAAPTAPSAAYVQAEATSMKTAVDAIRVALQNLGVTL